jgi:hypothetical protein
MFKGFVGSTTIGTKGEPWMQISKHQAFTRIVLSCMFKVINRTLT